MRCNTVLQSGSSSERLANGAKRHLDAHARSRTATYYWRAKCSDSAGNQSGWSAAALVKVDNVAPNMPAPRRPRRA